MNKITLLLFALTILIGCGVKQPPLPPMKDNVPEIAIDEEKTGVEEGSLEKTEIKKKKKVKNAPF